MKRLIFIFTLISPVVVHARPIFLEPAATSGRMAFEATVSILQRYDQYGSPQVDYDSTSFPVNVRLGLGSKVDFGVTFQHVSHRLETQNLRFSGSDSGRVSPMLKVGLRDNVSLLGIWHLHTGEENQGLPIARGDSPEIRFLAELPTTWPLCFDIGYFRQGRYNGRLGIQSSQLKDIDPGDVLDARAALLIPLPARLTASIETIYSSIGSEKINGTTISGSSGEALDLFGGLTWTYKDVVIGMGVGTGLLNESHTSFAIDRGAGDFTTKFLLSYKLQPKKAGS